MNIRRLAELHQLRAARIGRKIARLGALAGGVVARLRTWLTASRQRYALPAVGNAWVAFRSFAPPRAGRHEWPRTVHAATRAGWCDVASDGTQGNGTSEWPSISNDGSRIAFASVASNLSASDTNGVRDVFIHDRDTDDDGVFDEPENVFTERLSGTLGGALGNAPSDRPAIFGDGNGVVYESAAALVLEDTNADLDVYMTLFGGFISITRLVSDPVHVSNPANGTSFAVSVNVDGSVIAFTTLATNMFAGDTNGVSDVVVARGASLGFPITLERVTGAVQGDASSSDPAVSDDGGFVAFLSWATNLVPGDTGLLVDVFVADLDTHAITVESRRPDGASANSYTFDPSISADRSRRELRCPWPPTSWPATPTRTTTSSSATGRRA